MKKWIFEQWFSMMIMILSFAFFFLICFYPPEKLNNNIGEVKTALISIMSMVVQYWLGSSRSSAKKDDAAIASKPENKPVVTNADTVNVNSNNQNKPQQ